MAGLIFKKMSDVMKDVGAVGKNSTNNAQGFKFRGIDAFVNALHPALTKNGVFITPEVTQETHEIREVERSNGRKGYDKHVSLKVKYTFYAEDGSSVNCTVASEGLDSGDKATNKAMSAALKYALIQTFSVPTEDMEEADLTTPTISKLTTSPVLSTNGSSTSLVAPTLTAVSKPTFKQSFGQRASAVITVKDEDV